MAYRDRRSSARWRTYFTNSVDLLEIAPDTARMSRQFAILQNYCVTGNWFAAFTKQGVYIFTGAEVPATCNLPEAKPSSRRVLEIFKATLLGAHSYNDRRAACELEPGVHFVGSV